MIHPSLLFLDGHFETIPDFNVHTFLPYFLVQKAQDMRISGRGREVWLSGQVRPQHISWTKNMFTRYVTVSTSMLKGFFSVTVIVSLDTFFFFDKPKTVRVLTLKWL